MSSKFLNNIELTAGLVDNNGTSGSANQIIVSNGANGVQWDDLSAISRVVEGIQSDVIYYEVKNSSGAQIVKGKGVMAVGTDGNSGHILIDEMVADGTVQPRYFLGVLNETLNNGDIGRVIAFGEVDQINTTGQNGETWTDGQVLWCSPSFPGDFTITEPLGPNVKIPAAFILKASTQGKIQVRVQANEALKDLYDTKITTQSDGELLVWDNTTGVWFNDGTATIDYTNNRVGIGTTTPSTKLDVAGRAIIGTGNTIGTVDASIIGSNNNATTDTIIDSSTSAIIGDANSGRYGNTVISDKTLRIGRADNIGATTSNTTGILNFNDSSEGNQAFANIGGIIGYFPPPTSTNAYYFMTALDSNVLGSVFQPGASPEAARINMYFVPNLGTNSAGNPSNASFMQFDGNSSASGAAYFLGSQNHPNPSSRGIFTFDARHQNQSANVPDGHSLFEVTSGYGNTKFLIKQVSGSTNVGINTTSPSQKLHVVGNAYVTGAYYDSNNSPGTSGQILSSTATGTDWVSLSEISGVDGTGTANYVAKWSDTDTITDSVIYDNGTNVGIGTTSPTSLLTLESSGTSPYPGIDIKSTSFYPGGEIRFLNSAGTEVSSIESFNNPGVSYLKLNYGSGSLSSSIALDDGQLIFYTAGSERMRITSTGNVGIGTTNPTSKLEVNTGTDGVISRFRGSTNTGVTISGGTYEGVALSAKIHHESSNRNLVLETNGTGKLYFNTNGANARMVITDGGNVGIGTGSPTGKLEVRQDANNGNTGAFTNTHVKLTASAIADSTGFVGITAATSTADNYGYSFGAQRTSGGVGDFKINYHNNSAAGTNRFIIDQSGNVGIGTTSPSKLLELASLTPSIRIRSTKNGTWTAGEEMGSLEFYCDDASGGGAGVRGSIRMLAYDIYGYESNLTFNTGNDVERMRILSTGNVGIGTTSPGKLLELSGGANVAAIRLRDTTSNVWDIQNSTFGKLDFIRGGTNTYMRIDQGGNVGINTTTPQAKLDVNGGVRIANDASTAQASNVGTLRYRTSGNNSYVDMVMQTGASTYAWVNIVTNTW